MISQNRLKANRKNALKSTGPKTTEGKQVVAGNAVKYGLFAKLQVLPGIERQEDWEDHITQVMADLAPEGRMEVLLAERVALLMWRLARTARYEREVAAIALENAERNLPQRDLNGNVELRRTETPLKEAEGIVAYFQELLEFIDNLPASGEEAGKPVEFAHLFVRSVNLFADMDLKSTADPAMALLAKKGFQAKTAGDLWSWIEEVAKFRGITADELFDEVVRRTYETFDKAKVQSNRLTRLLDQYKRERLIPADSESQKIQRYEAHLERSLYKALHELQRMQGVRRGQAVPPPIALDVDVTKPGDGS